ncbi:MAG: hypothetical protein ACFNX0_05595, partial [Treponema sp.]
KPIFTVRPALWNPKLVLRRWGFIRVFLCKFAEGKLGWADTQLNLPKDVLCRPTKTASGQ